MGLVSGAVSLLKKAEAAVVVQNLLEHQVRARTFNLDPKEVAGDLVRRVWDTKPDMFNGSFGQRPYKIAVAAAALAYGISTSETSDANRAGLILSLGNVLAELETNGSLYPLNGIDHTLIESAGAVFMGATRKFQKSNAEFYPSFEEWYAEFKEEAGALNPQLRVDEGRSLLDFMDLGPLRLAFRDKVEPRKLAAEFAKQFDISTFMKGR